MCTVTFIKQNEQFIITSNRDEKMVRPAAAPPAWHIVEGKRLLFPKDGKAGGSWFVMNVEGATAVLLNGAAEKHISKGPYNKSRGLALLELMTGETALQQWKHMPLQQTEPFTVVLFEQAQLRQLRWNGVEKETLLLDEQQPHIWSSVTLYSADVIAARKTAFTHFLQQQQPSNEKQLRFFHGQTRQQGTEEGIMINRDNIMRTISITQAFITPQRAQMVYDDVIQNSIATQTFTLNQAVC
jgi:uncharacterized protein with NRDE domain